jgi:hypothetical protein
VGLGGGASTCLRAAYLGGCGRAGRPVSLGAGASPPSRTASLGGAGSGRSAGRGAGAPACPPLGPEVGRPAGGRADWGDARSRGPRAASPLGRELGCSAGRRSVAGGGPGGASTLGAWGVGVVGRAGDAPLGSAGLDPAPGGASPWAEPSADRPRPSTTAARWPRSSSTAGPRLAVGSRPGPGPSVRPRARSSSPSGPRPVSRLCPESGGRGREGAVGRRSLTRPGPGSGAAPGDDPGPVATRRWS